MMLKFLLAKFTVCRVVIYTADITYLRGVRGVLGALLGTSGIVSGREEATWGLLGVITILGIAREAAI